MATQHDLEERVKKLEAALLWSYTVGARMTTPEALVGCLMNIMGIDTDEAEALIRQAAADYNGANLYDRVTPDTPPLVTGLMLTPVARPQEPSDVTNPMAERVPERVRALDMGSNHGHDQRSDGHGGD